MSPLEVVFLGTSTFAVPALRSLNDQGHRIRSVVTQPDRPRGRGQKPAASPVKEAAESLGLSVLQPEQIKSIAGDLERLAPDALVVAAYGQFLSGRVIRAPRIAAINVHASLLPRYRGAAPVHWAILNGARESGVTIFRIVRKMDAGPILASRVTAIGDEETAGELEDRLAREGADLLAEVLEDLSGALRSEQPQDEEKATYAPRLQKEDGRLTFDRPPEDLRNRVRGLHPRPGAFSTLERAGKARERVRILQIAVAAREGDASPGEVVRASKEGIIVAAAGGAVRITRLQREGGRPLTAASFLRGRSVSPGDRFV